MGSMKASQQAGFADRIKRIERGGANTNGTTYTGAAEDDARRAKAARKVDQSDLEKPGLGTLLRRGLMSALLKVFVLGAGLALYLLIAGN
ncbi:hypothetical protein [Celeribacter litoreus]|uniref:hypothetical protein n=1 Tax=Celeribacter litoreus TaxID=2876714 RepID=UPI001CCEE97D|nr:hypothetical protein [Celeribacter litoreus]MCA0043883.1 hypothetical protein [Celeribacter litoreus]